MLSLPTQISLSSEDPHHLRHHGRDPGILPPENKKTKTKPPRRSQTFGLGVPGPVLRCRERFLCSGCQFTPCKWHACPRLLGMAVGGECFPVLCRCSFCQGFRSYCARGTHELRKSWLMSNELADPDHAQVGRCARQSTRFSLNINRQDPGRPGKFCPTCIAPVGQVWSVPTHGGEHGWALAKQRVPSPGPPLPTSYFYTAFLGHGA